jgi:hypothetical protein
MAKLKTLKNIYFEKSFKNSTKVLPRNVRSPPFSFNPYVKNSLSFFPNFVVFDIVRKINFSKNISMRI